MDKFHVNDKGVPGACSAKQGGCPFGGDAQHYASKEVAQQAFELSMASQSTPEPVRKEKAKVPSKKISAATTPVARPLGDYKINRDNFKPADFDGFEYDDLSFDSSAAFKNLPDRIENLPLDAYNREATKWVDMLEQQWKSQARTEPARSGETVPARLLPIGTHVRTHDSKYGGRPIGRPVVHEDGSVAASYHDGTQRDYVQPDTTFTVISLPYDKLLGDRSYKLPSAFKALNERAARLQKQRERLREHNDRITWKNSIASRGL